MALTTADTASVALDLPNVNQTVVIKDIWIFYNNAANTNPVQAAIVAQNAAHTRQAWVGELMVSGGVETLKYENLLVRIAPATAQDPGLRLFVTGASSDTLWAKVNYYLVSE